uniref:Uncharacterized protein n=1 Tax=Rhizophora mucronata TaxID=61149 RepID=A0A2P2QRL4_RHIMU
MIVDPKMPSGPLLPTSQYRKTTRASEIYPSEHFCWKALENRSVRKFQGHKLIHFCSFLFKMICRRFFQKKKKSTKKS